MQGLGALEFVLFGTGSEALAEPGDAYRCAYGAAIAGNVETIAARARRGLGRRRAVSRQWANPSADNPLYRDDTEAMTELIDVFVTGLEMVRDVRLGGFLGRKRRTTSRSRRCSGARARRSTRWPAKLPA